MSGECEICPFRSLQAENFKKLLGKCFRQDYQIPLTEAQLNELFDDMRKSFDENIIYIDLLLINHEAKGFIIYQVDKPESDWCEKETWGCIRELYVADDIRKKAYGKKLASHAEELLRKSSVPGIYLTADDAIGFWVKIGYRDSGEVCEKNKGNILIKKEPINDSI